MNVVTNVINVVTNVSQECLMVSRTNIINVVTNVSHEREPFLYEREPLLYEKGFSKAPQCGLRGERGCVLRQGE